MYDRRFFASKLGLAALASIAAMVSFNVFALTHYAAASPPLVILGGPAVILA
ncbi:hypothetical protein [Altericroceibacterium xinjiangense]|uniref:hypothetical protein n=1 Tax=Altericroceibacterium xinjiangense TaxID=762261 RepID=UPI0013DF8297|nr:hypothetical protein [Altericroceibacterium xinjiangense]